MRWFEWLDTHLFMRCCRFAPDLTILTSAGKTYLQRWYIIPQNKLLNFYYHIMHESDDDRASHDHRAHNMSIVLSGGYLEHIKGKAIWRAPGSVIFRKATTPHRIELPMTPHGPRLSCSLFVKLPDFRRWGYYCPKGWVDAHDFNEDSDGISKAGKGCG